MELEDSSNVNLKPYSSMPLAQIVHAGLRRPTQQASPGGEEAAVIISCRIQDRAVHHNNKATRGTRGE